MYTPTRAATLALLSLLCAPRDSAAEVPTSSYKLAAASNDAMLWLVVGELEPKEKTFFNWFAYLDRASTQIRPALGIRPQVGRIERAAVVGEQLHVFYDDGTHMSYSRQRERREVRLPGGVIPQAIAGESKFSPLLWAVVSAETGSAVASEWAKTLQERTTQPAETSSATQAESAPKIGSRPASSYELVYYDGAHWQPAFAAPEGVANAHRVWLSVASGRFHLFWQTTADAASIQYAWSEKEGWTQGPAVSLTRSPQQAWAGVLNAELILAALVPERRGAAGLRPEIWRRPAQAAGEGGYWNQISALKTAEGQPLVMPAGSCLAAFANSLVIMRVGESEAEVGFWNLSGGGPDQPFKAVPIRRQSQEPTTHRGTREMVTLLVVALVLLAVVWRRQGGFPVAVALPPSVSLAPPAKRLLAAVVDMAPAAALVLWWWWQPFTTFYREASVSNPTPEMIEALWPAELFWAGLTFRVLYTVYSLVFELLWNRTPGKRLLGCTVVSESLTSPTWVQITVRNLTRLVELEPNLMIWPFMVVILVTRSRQRLGDLIARTLVVDQEATASETEQM